MNTLKTMKQIAISMLALSSAAAFAGNRADAVPLRPPVALQSGLTRADVTAEYIRARNEGTLVIVGDAVPLQPQVSLPSGLTRADVRADYIRSRNAGTLVIVGDAAPLHAQPVTQGPSRDRDAVKAEAAQAARAYLFHDM